MAPRHPVRAALPGAGPAAQSLGRCHDRARDNQLAPGPLDRLEGSLAFLVSSEPPCILFEDEDLLVVNKPPGLNTHSPAPYAGEGLYDWLRHREPRWAALAIIHRLDKETSGLIVFGKSSLANRSLTQQFTQRTVTKKYLFLTDRPIAPGPFIVRSHLVRAGERYLSRPDAPG